MNATLSGPVCLDCRYPLAGLDRNRCPECGRAFSPDDPASVGWPGDRPYLLILSLIRRIRPFALPVVMAWAWYLATTLRTMSEASVLGGLLICSVIAATTAIPPALLLWLGLPRKRYALAIALTVLLPALLAAGVASFEEHLFVAHCRTLPPTTPTVFKNRWWPNEDHHLGFEPATGYFWGGD